MEQSERNSSKESARGWLGAFAIISSIFGLMLWYSNFESESLSEKQSQVVRSVVNFSGEGETIGTEKRILGGDYKISWETFGKCYYAADLSSGESLFTAGDLASSNSYLYELVEGEYFLNVNTGPVPNCPWQISFVPIE
jgi:hypothetical protein